MTGDGNWTWFIPGQVPTLIDAGVGQPAHVDAIVEAAAGAPLQVLVTHGHSDHASGAAAIAARLPGSRFLKMPWTDVDATRGVPWEPIGDGDVFSAGDVTLTAVHTPGHATDHLCFWSEAARALFGGDLAIATTTVWIPSREGAVAAYLASLERVLALRPARIYPAHGPVIDDPAALLTKYLAHRRRRDAQILDALRRGPATVPVLVSTIYREVPDVLTKRAIETVTAHLLKLQHDGLVDRDGEAWHIIEP